MDATPLDDIGFSGWYGFCHVLFSMYHTTVKPQTWQHRIEAKGYFDSALKRTLLFEIQSLWIVFCPKTIFLSNITGLLETVWSDMDMTKTNCKQLFTSCMHVMRLWSLANVTRDVKWTDLIFNIIQ
jgi:hypothetical protein